MYLIIVLVSHNKNISHNSNILYDYDHLTCMDPYEMCNE